MHRGGRASGSEYSLKDVLDGLSKQKRGRKGEKGSEKGELYNILHNTSSEISRERGHESGWGRGPMEVYSKSSHTQ